MVNVDIDECVVITTGGSRGIGRAVALSFARKSCNIVIAYISSREGALEMERLTYTYSARNGFVLQMDVVNEISVHSLEEPNGSV